MNGVALIQPTNSQMIIETLYDVKKPKYALINTVRDVFSEHYRDPAFLELVSACPSFKHTTDSPQDVANNINSDTSTIKVGIFKPAWYWSRCIASTDIATKTISFNKYQLKGADIEERVNTLMHEYIHTLGYTHEGNYNTPYNRETAPYVIGDLFAKYLKDNKFI